MGEKFEKEEEDGEGAYPGEGADEPWDVGDFASDFYLVDDGDGVGFVDANGVMF